MTTTSRLPRSSPEQQGIASARITEFIRSADKDLQHLHSVMLLRHGKVIAEGWWNPWKPETPHMLFSLSKSFASTAVGCAVAEGRLSVDDPVSAFFPTDLPKKMSPNLRAMKVHHLLSMSTGHHQDTSGSVFPSRTPFKEFLSLEVEHAPGTYFIYNTAATFMLSAIIQRLTNQTLLEYLQPRLFKPLGIEAEAWESHPNGVNFGGWGLSIKTEDIAQFGQLYLQKGLWNGERIVPESWVEAATCKQVSNGNDPESDWCQGYGYQFWRCRHNSYRGDGAFGQFCIVMPEQDAVLAITAGLPDMQVVLNLVWEKLLPAFGEKELPPAEADHQALERRLTHLAIEPPVGSHTSPMAAQVSGKTYIFETNYETLHSLRFDFSDQSGTLITHLLGGGTKRGKRALGFGYSAWQEGQSALGGFSLQCVAASGTWTAEDTFKLTLCQVETPFIQTITCRFEGDLLYFDFESNVAFGPTEKPQLVGKSE